VMRLPCPHCGPRDELEFTWGGEAHLQRPEPATATDDAWRDYLYTRRNPAGVHHERWCHTYGCGQWFHLARDTVTHRVERAYPITEKPDGQ
jgi:sarcosine oxidase, subunit delta